MFSSSCPPLLPPSFCFLARLSLLTSVPFPSSRLLPLPRCHWVTPWAESWRWLFKSTPYALIQFPLGRPLWPPSSLPLPLHQLRHSLRERGWGEGSAALLVIAVHWSLKLRFQPAGSDVSKCSKQPELPQNTTPLSCELCRTAGSSR